MASLASARSLLFAPGNDERKLRRALGAGADAVIADLEDAVPAADKARARELAASLLGREKTASLRMMRINSVGGPYWEDDFAATAAVSLDALVVPKATPEAIATLGLEGPPVLAIIETAQGLRLAWETASLPRVAALILGAVDLGREVGLEPRADGAEILYARSKLVIDSAAAGIRAPFDAVHLNVADEAVLEAECRLARSFGIRGKPCIHPAQVEVVNRAFSPNAGELERARRVVSAYEEGERQGRGAVALDGEMIDLPIVERARDLLDSAERRSDGS